MRQIASVNSGLSRAGKESRKIVVGVGGSGGGQWVRCQGAVETRGEFSVSGDLTVWEVSHQRPPSDGGRVGPEWLRSTGKGLLWAGGGQLAHCGGREARVGTGRVRLVNAAGRGDPWRMVPVFSVLRRRLATC